MPILPHFNIKPVHRSFTTLASGSAHTNLTNFVNSDTTQGFSTFTALGTGSAHTALKNSGFQYLLSAGTSMVNISFTETTQSYDYLTTGARTDAEQFQSLDTFGRSDTNVVQISFQGDTNPVNESFTRQDLTNYAITGTFRMSIMGSYQTDGGLKMSIVNNNYDLYTMNMAIIPYTLQGVTNIYDPASSVPTPPAPFIDVSYYNYTPPNPTPFRANPFQPTLILGGNTVVSHPASAPSPTYSPGPSTYLVSYVDSPIGNATTCNLINFNLSFTDAGGEFNLTSTEPVGPFSNPRSNCLEPIVLFGLNGTITDCGQSFSNSFYGYQTNGIFGTPNLNKQLNILLANNQQLFELLTNQFLVNAQVNSFSSFADAARAIAAAAGISLSWNITDVPIVNFFVQEGDTALSALNSIVTLLGGKLRWTGGNAYAAVYPNQYQGNFVIPDQSLITAQGTQYVYKSDLATGTSGTGLLAVPVIAYFDRSVYGPPNTLASPPIQRLWSTSKPFTSDDPAVFIDLPLNVDEVYIQILVQPGDATSTSGTTSASNYVTTDSNTFYNVGGPDALSNGPVIISNGLGDPYQPQVKIDYTQFPNLDAVNNGNFTMTVGCTLNDPGATYQEQLQDREMLVNQIIATTIGQYRYVKAYEGQINCYFFGAIPVPGMYAQATVCGNLVEGIIESVNFSYPGILTITVAQYLKIDFIRNFYSLTLTDFQLGSQNVTGPQNFQGSN